MNNIKSLYRVIPAKKKTYFWFILILVFGKSLFDLLSICDQVYRINNLELKKED